MMIVRLVDLFGIRFRAAVPSIGWVATLSLLLLDAETARAYYNLGAFWQPCGELDAHWTPEWSHLQAYWKLNELTAGTAPGGADINDYSGNGVYGTQGGGVTFGAAGKIGKAISMSGAVKYVTATVPSIDTTAGDTVSVSLWVNWNGTYPAGGWDVMVALYPYDLSFSNDGSIGINTTHGEMWGTSSIGLANNWVHLVVLFYNGSEANSQLYINGVQQTLSLRFGTTQTASVSGDLWVGNNNSGILGNDYTFQGLIDEVAVWNAALTPAEIQTIYSHQRNLMRLCP